MLRRLQRYHLPQLLLSLFSCGHDSSPRYVYHLVSPVARTSVTVPSVHRKSERMLRAQTCDESHSVMKGCDSMTFEPWSAFMTAMHQCTQQWLSNVAQCRTNYSPVCFRQTRSDRLVRLSTLTEATGSPTAVLITRPTRNVHKEPWEARRDTSGELLVNRRSSNGHRFLKQPHTSEHKRRIQVVDTSVVISVSIVHSAIKWW